MEQMRTDNDGSSKIVFKELSYEIVGCLYDVFNELGYGYHEKHYERALMKCFETKDVKYKNQVPYKLFFKDRFIGYYYLDFLVENKIILEIKQGNYFSRTNIVQANAYLKKTGLKLAILANFTSKGIRFLRLLNIY